MNAPPPDVFGRVPYPHVLGCECCRQAGHCSSCGAFILGDLRSCEHGRCHVCHSVRCNRLTDSTWAAFSDVRRFVVAPSRQPPMLWGPGSAQTDARNPVDVIEQMLDAPRAPVRSQDDARAEHRRSVRCKDGGPGMRFGGWPVVRIDYPVPTSLLESPAVRAFLTPCLPRNGPADDDCNDAPRLVPPGTTVWVTGGTGAVVDASAPLQPLPMLWGPGAVRTSARNPSDVLQDMQDAPNAPPPRSMEYLQSLADAFGEIAASMNRPIPYALVDQDRDGFAIVVVDGLDVEAIDWSNVTPDPRAADLNARCVCGLARGEHAARGLQRADDESGRVDCNGWDPAELPEVWHESGRGLLPAGWYRSTDHEGRTGPFESEKQARRDGDS